MHAHSLIPNKTALSCPKLRREIEREREKKGKMVTMLRMLETTSLKEE
jgi:hypothetical protein